MTHDHKVASAAPRVLHMRDGQIVREQTTRAKGALFELDAELPD